MIPYIDLHCDTLSLAFRKSRPDILDFPDAMLDGKRLKQAGCMAQFFAIFMPQPEDEGRFPPISDDDYISALVEIFQNSLRDALVVGELTDLQKISGFLTLEDGRAVDGSLEKLERFYDMGIRLITLTWNYPNCLGFPNSFDRTAMEQGLTPFGRDAVVRMQELGMLVDVSHLSDGGFWDVAELCKQPFVASHSNCRSLSPHPRNLTDEMIRALADRGGIMGVNFCPAFLTHDITSKESRVEDLVRHLRHMINVGGEDCPAIGSDLDGIDGNIQLGSAEKIPLLFEALEASGFTSAQIEKIAWKNSLRVLEELDKAKFG